MAVASVLLSTAQLAWAVAPFQEYAAQRGLRAINVLPAWDSATGKGVIIAIVDSGVKLSHEDLRSNLVSFGHDFVNNDDLADDDSFDGHGTGLAGVAAAARNGVGIVGVAYDAKILPVKVRNAQRERRPDLEAAGIRYATNQGANVISLSLPGDFQDPIANAIVEATAAGKIVVMAAGNTAGGGPLFPAYLVVDPQLQGRAIAVGSLGPDGRISDFSNRAGTRMNYYVVAPGEDILTTSNGGSGSRAAGPAAGTYAASNSYAVMSGTSFAAPHVAGIVALVLEQSPNIAPETAVRIVLETARDLGAPGVDPVYGRGAVDAAAALSPQGDLGVPSGGGGGGSGGGGAAVVALALGGAVGYALLNKSDKIEQTLVLDKYGRGYAINLDKATEVNDSHYDLPGLMQSMERDYNWLEMPLFDDVTARLYYSTPTQPLYDGLEQHERAALTDSFSDDLSRNIAFELSGNLNQDLSYSLGYNLDPRQQFGNAREIHDNGAMFLSNQAFGTSYLGFAQTANNLTFSYDAGSLVDFKLGYNEMLSGTDYGQSSRTVLLQGDVHPSDRLTLGLQLGVLNEDGNLFGGSSANVWGVDSTKTLSLGLSGAYDISANSTLIANYAIGYSQVNAMDNGILRDFSGIRSNSYGFGLLTRNVLRRHDAAGVAWSQPLRATSGEVTVDVPVAIDVHNNIRRDSERVGLAPTGREQDLEAMYATDIGRRSRLGAHFLYQHEPQHNDRTGDAMTVLFTLRSEF